MDDLAARFRPELHMPQMVRDMPCANAQTAWSIYLTEIEHRMKDVSFAEGFRKLCPVDGVRSAEYSYRLHRDGELSFLSSIRFAGLSLAEPFVEILLCNRSLDETCLTQITEFVKPEYVKFKPKRVRYFSPDDLPVAFRDQEDFAFFAESSSAIRNSEIPLRFVEVEVRAATSLEFYPELLRIYEGLKVESPYALDPEPLASLEISLSQGLVYEAFIKDQWAGMMSAQRSTERFYSGVFIVEEVLDKQFRGQGYAPAMQRKFIDQLEADQFVFGEILVWNVRSRRTAMRVGRRKCGTTYFHHIE